MTERKKLGCLTAVGLGFTAACCAITGASASVIAVSESAKNAVYRTVDSLDQLRSNLLGLDNSTEPMVVFNPEATATATATPEVIIPTTPSIEVGGTNHGIYLDTELGKRMTFTSRSVLVPNKKWNQPLTAEELRTVETTWLETNVSIPEGMTGVVFAGGFEQGTTRYENGVLMTLKPGQYKFNLRNGEIVMWYPNQEDHQADDLDRIIAQIEFGNFDIDDQLSIFVVTPDLLTKIPQKLVEERGIELASFPEAK